LHPIFSRKPFASAALKRECNPAGAANTLDFRQLATSTSLST
jgi:hypothetical protein